MGTGLTPGAVIQPREHEEVAVARPSRLIPAGAKQSRWCGFRHQPTHAAMVETAVEEFATVACPVLWERWAAKTLTLSNNPGLSTHRWRLRP